ncbi:aminopeptidase P family protein [Egibacter rhizosphaerae]|uniref:Aminopeptidase P family protein n=1 Tax=Egibacter rhizosphaerae TaxID=1670831 RepID=A0A411YIF0_9ACTN|nr:Xaa-Pro peptidase family protein [Egibacter rhizosphaerae]QBI20866.1 aminopeptidase P family protein [Egibacter rhizosphaerae]
MQQHGLGISSPGAMHAVEWESRVDMNRLRTDRIERMRDELRRSELGALLLFDQNNIRYATGTHIGNWARDKFFRCVLVMQDHDPILWDIGSAAKKHRLFAPWFDEDSWRAGISSWRGSIPEDVGVERTNAARVAGILHDAGLAGEPVGIDIVELPVLFALQGEGLEVRDAQGLMQRARRIKTADEIALLDQAAGLVDGVYEELFRYMRAGVRENDCVALVNRLLYERGSEEVENVNAISGERCSPHPHVFSDRSLRQWDTAYFDIMHSLNGYRTCYYRTFNVGGATQAQVDAYKRAREFIDRAIAEVKPGATSADVIQHFPAAHEFGFEDEEEAFGLQYCHGIGLSAWEQPLMSRYHSHEYPVEIEEGMVFALETYWPTEDGSAAARIEEEVVVTADGARIITRFPADELLVTGIQYWRGADLAVPASLEGVGFSQATMPVPSGNGAQTTQTAGATR